VTFFLAIIHIWLLGVLPIIAVGFYIFQKNESHLYLKSLSEPLLLIALIAAIFSIFLYLAFSFLIAQFYMTRADSATGNDRRERGSYYLMVLGPVLYFLLIHLFLPSTLMGEFAESGIISMFSQHAILHLIYLILLTQKWLNMEGSIAKKFLLLTAYVLIFITTIIVSARLYLAFIISEKGMFWRIVFHLTLFYSTLGSFRYFYANRGLLWKIRRGF
jgi:hypothetical protein